MTTQHTNPDVRVRLCLRGDLIEIAAMDRAQANDAWTFEQWHEMASKDKHVLIQAEHRGELVGVMLFKLTQHSIRVVRVLVAKRFRRGGIGRDLLNFRLLKRERTLLCDVDERALDLQCFMRACGLRAVNSWSGRVGRKRRRWIRFVSGKERMTAPGGGQIAGASGP